MTQPALGESVAGRQLRDLTLDDALTGLPNRFQVYERVREQLAGSTRRQGSAVVMSVDIDGFRKVNYTFGQAAGDELLQVVGERLSRAVRKCDMVGRLGGDQFAVIVGRQDFNVRPEMIAAGLLRVLHEPIELASANGGRIAITASIGIAYGHAIAVDDLFRDADLALYEAKRGGKNRFAVFEPQMHTGLRERDALEIDLQNALEADQLSLVYQPIFDLHSGLMTGVEALMRWRHPRLGSVAPASFIPIAEETGVIVRIGRWALERACRHAAQWQPLDGALDVSVNVSTRQLERREFLDEVRSALSRSSLPASKLTLEITETSLMLDSVSTTRRLRSLKALGIRITIDDFGTGYSSLAYLHQFPVDELKIDRSFISGRTPAHESSDALIRALVQLGKARNICVVAEGIEDSAQLQRLRRGGCDRGQGFLLARPVRPSVISERIKEARHTADRWWG